MPTSTVEDYLKAIHRFTGDKGELASLGKVSRSLGITAGTATTMMKKLESQGLADYSPRKGVRLTPSGNRAVLLVLRRHRLLELFLVETLGFDWTEVHEEAEVLEHSVSDLLIDRIDEMLGFPARDPHGDPIPDADGALRVEGSKRLDDFTSGQLCLVRVTHTTRDFLDWLSQIGLLPGANFELIGRDSIADLYSIRVDGHEETVQFGQKVVEHLWVREADFS